MSGTQAVTSGTNGIILGKAGWLMVANASGQCRRPPNSAFLSFHINVLWPVKCGQKWCVSLSGRSFKGQHTVHGVSLPSTMRLTRDVLDRGCWCEQSPSFPNVGLSHEREINLYVSGSQWDCQGAGYGSTAQPSGTDSAPVPSCQWIYSGILVQKIQPIDRTIIVQMDAFYGTLTTS